MSMKNKKLTMEKGFTLVEMIVAIGLFTITLFISSSAFLVVLDADRKSRATRIAMDNLNLSLEDMSRRIKTGNAYNCGGTGGTADCAVVSSQDVFAFNDQGGDRIIYKRGEGAIPVTAGNGLSGCGSSLYISSQGCIVRDKGGTALRVTGPEIDITDLRFVVKGSTVWAPGGGGDISQPYVAILVGGTTLGKITTGFKMQTMVTQRAYDI